MANEPLPGSSFIAGKKVTDGLPGAGALDDNYSPPRIVVELPDRALRDLGVVDIGAVPGAATIDNNQVAVAATATSIISARATRRSVLIVNHSSVNIYIGKSGVATTTGLLLKGTAGAALTIETAAAVFGISESGTNTVSYLEVYD